MSGQGSVRTIHMKGYMQKFLGYFDIQPQGTFTKRTSYMFM